MFNNCSGLHWGNSLVVQRQGHAIGSVVVRAILCAAVVPCHSGSVLRGDDLFIGDIALPLLTAEFGHAGWDLGRCSDATVRTITPLDHAGHHLRCRFGRWCLYREHKSLLTHHNQPWPIPSQQSKKSSPLLYSLSHGWRQCLKSLNPKSFGITPMPARMEV